MNAQERIIEALNFNVFTQQEYERVLTGLANMRLEKVIQYGEDRYNEPDPNVNLLMCYSDVYRKYIRLKKLSFDFKNPDYESLIDTYKDLANYAIMAIQILEKERNRE